VAVTSVGSYANHLHFTPQITTPASHHSTILQAGFSS